MRSRWARVALALFEAVWLNIIVPGHQRGIVQLPGSPCPMCRWMAAHETSAAGHDGKHSGSIPTIPGDPAEHCAICHFAAALSTPPPIDLAPPAMGFLEFCTLAVSRRVCSISCLATYDGRAPPSSFVCFS